MPASLPGSSLANNLLNPSDGPMVLIDPVSGPKGSPLDNDKQTDIVTGVVTARGGCSTGALQTGIGFGSPPIIGPTAPASILAAGFTDDYIPGQSDPASTDTMDSTYMYVGGGRCTANVGGAAPVSPYTSGMTPILAAGNGGSRDAGAGPAYTGFFLKTVTATGTVANGSAVETGFLNRSGVSIVSGQSVFGSSAAASSAIS